MVDSPDDEITLAAARDGLERHAATIDRTDRIPLSVAVGRVLATDATASVPVPEADVGEGDTVFEADTRVRPADVGLLKAAGVDELLVRQRPQVGILPTGDELVGREPGPHERVETAGFALAQYVDRWGGKVTYRGAVDDTAPSLRMAVQRDLTRDMLVVTGTEPGDTLRQVVGALGEIVTDHVAINPGRQTGVAVVEDRPVLLLPESSTGARVAAVQLVRPLLKTFAGVPTGDHPTRTATLATSPDWLTDGEVRSFVPVSLDGGSATPLEGIDLGATTRADGWITVSPTDPPAAGDAVDVENWDYLP